MLTLQVRDTVRAFVPTKLRSELRRQVVRAMRAAGVDAALVSLTLSDDEELHELNLEYADEDHPTDVLSFAQRDADPGFVVQLPPGAVEPLGDVIISVQIAQRQADAQGHDLLSELCHLSVHGLCHLLGMDHRDAQEERWMFGYEALLRKEARGLGRITRQQMPPAPESAKQEEHPR